MIQYDMQTIGLINHFEKTTGAKVKDCFTDDEGLVFVVYPKELRKALEHGGEKVRKLGFILKKRIKVIEFNEEIQKFVQNLLYPIRAETELQNNVLLIKGRDAKEKGQIFGRERTNLKKMQNIVNKYFSIELKVM